MRTSSADKAELAEPCRGMCPSSAQKAACLDIDASQEPRCRPTPRHIATRHVRLDSSLRDSAMILFSLFGIQDDGAGGRRCSSTGPLFALLPLLFHIFIYQL